MQGQGPTEEAEAYNADNGEWPNTAAPVPPLPPCRKRPRDKEESSNNAHLHTDNNPGKKTATGSAEFGVALENVDSSEALPDQAGDWADKFGELRGYRQRRGHCSFRDQDPEHVELSKWVFSQRCEYRRMVGGKDSILTPKRVEALNRLGFVWRHARPCWEDRFSQLADFHFIHGHCSIPVNNNENTKLANFVRNQRNHYRLHLKGEKSYMTPTRIQALESVGIGSVLTWEDRLSELADFQIIHGHCNVPKRFSENTQLGNWVGTQRKQYKLHIEGKTSYMTLSRIHELESLGFEWGCYTATWEDRLSELADYRKVHGHCNVPYNYSENSKLASWVENQRSNYKFQLEGKASPMTAFRIQELESLGFEWKPSIGVTPSIGVDVTAWASV
jgi:hypothetical protein